MTPRTKQHARPREKRTDGNTMSRGEQRMARARRRKEAGQAAYWSYRYIEDIASGRAIIKAGTTLSHSQWCDLLGYDGVKGMIHRRLEHA